MLALSPGLRAQEALRLEEVLVTAQKRTQSLQDVPVSITALGEATLDSLNITNFSEYVQQLPAVSFTQRRPGDSVHARHFRGG